MSALSITDAAQATAQMRVILAEPPRFAPASAAAVRAVLDYVAAGQIQASVVTASGDLGPILVMNIPGRASVLMIPEPGTLGTTRDDVRVTLDAWTSSNSFQQLYFAQALTEPGARGRSDLLTQCGFQQLTELHYLHRDASYPWIEPDAKAEFVPFSDANAALFTACVAESYADSQDFPELTGLRPTDAALESHRAAGEFRASFWQVLLRQGEPAGCLLLAAHPSAGLAEVAYLGVRPAHRRAGVGTLLVARALQLARAARLRRVTLVVDARNSAARALYAQLGFTSFATRMAHLRVTGSGLACG